MRQLAIVASLLATSSLCAQTDRLSGPIDSRDSRRTVVLKGHIKREVQPQFDRGPVDPALRISGILLTLKRSAAQQAELEQLLIDQQDQSSPEYHRWLTPLEFANRFGFNRADIARISDWLASEGFSIDNIADGRNWILFSGTAGQIRRTLNAELHHYLVDGETHYANTADPSVPAALAPLVLSITGLDDFRMKSTMRYHPMPHLDPRYTGTDGSHTLVPADLATIYDITPLYAKGIDGTGQKVAVIGQTDINIPDVQLFRTTFGLGSNDPQKVLVKGSANPGVTKGDIGEANLDLDWTAAVAPKATVMYVYSTNVYNSVAYAIDQNIAPVMSMSYGYCEPKISSTPAQAATTFQTSAQQANAQGITWVASSGDSGAPDCDSDTGLTSVNGFAVDLPASVPEVTGVGGTEFNEGTGRYWNPTNGTNNGSAAGYIPEMAWNDSALGGGLASGGGGASIFFPKPVWQTGPGVPNDNARDVPDVSFTASADHDGYWIAMNGKITCCSGGTSVATPVFAAILTLLNQYQSASGSPAKPGLGNVNPNLYALAQTSTGIFHDVAAGSNIVPCTAGTTNCAAGSIGFSAGPGYDQATGLGSADVYNLVTQWSMKPSTATTTTVAAIPATIVVTASTTITATVKAATGTTTPTGTVSFSVGNTALGSANLAGSGGAATASLTVAGNQLAIGSNTIKASYSGSNGFSPSSGSATVSVTVPTTASAPILSVVPNPVYQQDTDADGYAWFFTVKITEIAGTATSLTAFSIDGVDYSSNIVAWFGSATLPAHGSLSVSLRSKLTTVPANRVFKISGVDPDGATWSQQVTIPFYGKQLSASISLTSAPGIVIQDPGGYTVCDSDYPFYQELNLQEKNGYEVYLTKFLNAGNDDSSSIEVYFGSWRLAPLGSLQAGICWQLAGSPPQNLTFEVDGVDSNGNKISTTLSVPFQAPLKNPGKLSVSRKALGWSVNPGQSKNDSIAVTVPPGQQWSISVFPANQRTSWLTVSPLSGTGPATVNLTAASAGLTNGAYSATLVFQSVNTFPQFINVPVVFVVGESTTTVINGIANAASFDKTFAPGMILSVFGANLTNSSTAMFAPSVPLPTTLGGVTVQVNNVPAGFYYASRVQLNIQMPYETPEGTAILTVNNNGQVAVFPFEVQGSAPGIFVGSGSTLVPSSTGKRGQTVTLFMTGEGDVSPPIATGATPSASTPLSQLPAPRLPLTLTLAGINVNPDFVGIPYGLVGETQINFTIPPNTPIGLQQVVVKVGDFSSVAAKINVTQ